jgi:cyclase
MCETCIFEDLSRRGLLLGAGALSAWWLLNGKASAANADAAFVGEPKEVAPGVFFLQGGTRYFMEGTRESASGSVRSLMCNNGWVIFRDFVLLVDANMPGRADDLLAAVRRTTDKPIRYIFNTHHHGDHIYGNRILAERTQASVIAHSGLTEELRRYETGSFGGAPGRWEAVAKLRPDVAASSVLIPASAFETSHVIDDGFRRVELLHLGRGHTQGDAVLWMPQEKVLFTGDLAANGPFNIVRDALMVEWTNTLARMSSLGAAAVCPGHGPLANNTLVLWQKAFFEALIAEVGTRKRRGVTRDAFLADLPSIRAALLGDQKTAHYVIPEDAELSVLSLRAQAERTWDQLD